jgi:hypothetical protein
MANASNSAGVAAFTASRVVARTVPSGLSTTAVSVVL